MFKTLLFIYLGGVSQAATVICAVFSSIFILAAIGFYIGSFCYENYKDETEKKMRAMFARMGKWFCIIGVAMAFTGVVLPDRQVCYMAAAVSSAEYITQETEIGKALNETSVTLIKDVGKIVHDMANPKKTKVVTVDE
jgi:hypothetical protein